MVDFANTVVIPSRSEVKWYFCLACFLMMVMCICALGMVVYRYNEIVSVARDNAKAYKECNDQLHPFDSSLNPEGPFYEFNLTY